MSDPRVTKMAQVLIKYSFDLQPGQKFILATSPLAEELSLAVYKEAVLAGAHVFVMNNLPGSQEIFLKHASDAQLDYADPIQKFAMEIIGPLVRYDEDHRGSLVQTLNAYFTHHGNISQTAESLFVHRNTLLYRMERIQELTGQDLNNSDMRLALHLSLKLWQLRLDTTPLSLNIGA